MPPKQISSIVIQYCKKGYKNGINISTQSRHIKVESKRISQLDVYSSHIFSVRERVKYSSGRNNCKLTSASVTLNSELMSTHTSYCLFFQNLLVDAFYPGLITAFLIVGFFCLIHKTRKCL